MSYKAFWSYVHKDNENDSGRILSLGRDIAAEYEAIAGETVELFIDEDAIRWGDEWQKDIDQGLASIAFFVPILTPRFFMSSACRRETQTFLSSAKRLGVTDLVLPLLYIDAPQLHSAATTDQLVIEMKRFQWVDWRDLRFESRSSSDYRRGINKLARRILSADVRSDVLPSSIPSDSPVATSVVSMSPEQTLEQLAEVLGSLDAEVDSLDALLEGSNSPAEDPGSARPATGYRPVSKSLLDAIGQRSLRIASLANELAALAYEFDAAGRATGLRVSVASDFLFSLDAVVRLTDVSRGKMRIATSTLEGSHGLFVQSKPSVKNLNQALLSLEEIRGLFATWRQDVVSEG